MCFPAIWLSFGTICSAVAAALVAIAFATDNWVEYRVDRRAILSVVRDANSSPEYGDVWREMNRTTVYFDRTVGLWRTCFPTEVPFGMETYQSPTDTTCANINYPKEIDASLTSYEKARIHLMRTILALFIAGFAMEVLTFLVGVFGCWKRSPGLLWTTGTFMFLAFLLDAGAMAIWHGVEYMEQRKISTKYYRPTWPEVLESNTSRWYSWSFMLAWIGTGFALLAALFLYAGAGSLRSEKRRERERNAQYIMPVYSGYGEKQPPYYAHAYSGPYYYTNTNSYRY